MFFNILLLASILLSMYVVITTYINDQIKLEILRVGGREQGLALSLTMAECIVIAFDCIAMLAVSITSHKALYIAPFVAILSIIPIALYWRQKKLKNNIVKKI